MVNPVISCIDNSDRSMEANKITEDNNRLFKVNLEMAIFGFDLENEISVCVRNWELKTWVLKPRFENPDSWLLSKKAIIN